VACAEAARDAEPGRIHYARTEDSLRAAVTLAPEQPLAEAIGILFAVQLGLIDALGALAPPEIAVHVQWPDRLRVNGALCGQFRAAASTVDPAAEPDWLVIGLDVPILPRDDIEPGEQPDETCLFAEGCGELTASELLEGWSRHMLVWIHTYLTEGFAPLHEAWRGKCDAIGSDVTQPRDGHFVGLDERGGMVLRTGDETRLLPLTQMLEAP
jgi:biotin-(acetyl-CoA carboxylase) ligase